MLCLNDEIICSQMTDRHLLAPWGLEGGKEGGCGATFVMKSGSQKWQTMREAYGKASTSRYSNVSIRRGDRVRLVTPGGGGYGDPAKRDRAAIERDLREGYISEHAASKFYRYQEI
jgi:N-methylhydantoinase B